MSTLREIVFIHPFLTILNIMYVQWEQIFKVRVETMVYYILGVVMFLKINYEIKIKVLEKNAYVNIYEV